MTDREKSYDSDGWVVLDTNFLILGEDVERGWTKLLQGGKVGDAVCRKIADENCQLCIVLESDFIDFLMAHLQAQEGCTKGSFGGWLVV